jgi:hypothetical protein
VCPKLPVAVTLPALDEVTVVPATVLPPVVLLAVIESAKAGVTAHAVAKASAIAN